MMDYDRKILIIDDNEVDRILIKEHLSDIKDCGIIETGNARSGLHYYLNGNPGCTILDYHLNDEMDGLGILREFQNTDRLTTPVIFVTSGGSDKVVKAALASGAFLYFDKDDLGNEAFKNAVETCLLTSSQKGF